jgi:hypothetical protein
MDHFLLEIDRGESTKNFPFDLHLPDGNAVVTYTYLQASLLTKLLTHEDPGYPQVTEKRPC